MAMNFYLWMKGEKQGDIKGECTVEHSKDSIVCSAFESGCVAPFDAQTGMGTGRRRYTPVKITHEVDMASPGIWQALSSNEAIKEATLKFWKASLKGTPEHFYTIKLTNGRITGAKIRLLGQEEHESAKVPMQEDVEFTFQKIEWIHEKKSKMATDDWDKPAAA
jgi:type VI secretion system secreted protein Hcp